MSVLDFKSNNVTQLAANTGPKVHQHEWKLAVLAAGAPRSKSDSRPIYTHPSGRYAVFVCKCGEIWFRDYDKSGKISEFAESIVGAILLIPASTTPLCNRFVTAIAERAEEGKSWLVWKELGCFKSHDLTSASNFSNRAKPASPWSLLQFDDGLFAFRTTSSGPTKLKLRPSRARTRTNTCNTCDAKIGPGSQFWVSVEKAYPGPRDIWNPYYFICCAHCARKVRVRKI